MNNNMMSLLNEYEAVAEFVRIILYGLIVYGVILYRYLRWKTVKLPCGSFKVRRRDWDVQKITNIVSQHFYNGGHVDDNVRKKILELVNPEIKHLSKAKEEEADPVQGSKDAE